MRQIIYRLVVVQRVVQDFASVSCAPTPGEAWRRPGVSAAADVTAADYVTVAPAATRLRPSLRMPGVLTAIGRLNSSPNDAHQPAAGQGE